MPTRREGSFQQRGGILNGAAEPVELRHDQPGGLPGLHGGDGSKGARAATERFGADPLVGGILGHHGEALAGGVVRDGGALGAPSPRPDTACSR